MQILNQDLKSREFKQIYLLYGEEEYLKKNYKNRLKKALVGEDNINISYLIGRGIDIDDFIDKAQTLPFLAEKRCIFIEDSNWFKITSDRVVEFLDILPSTTYLIFIEKEVDKRNKLYKKINKMGYSTELSHPSLEGLKDWVARILIQQEGKKIITSNMDYLLSCIGNDMERAYNEIQKLLDYLGEKEIIEREDIDAIVSVTLENRIFDMVIAIIGKRMDKALQLYQNLLILKESPLRILYLIARQFNQLLLTKDMLEKNMGKREIANQLKVQEFVAEKLIKQVREHNKQNLKNQLEYCIEIEEAIKTGQIEDIIGVSMVIVGR